jgi:hypothetical protein
MLKLTRTPSIVLGLLMLLVAWGVTVVGTVSTAPPAHATHEYGYGHWWSTRDTRPAPPIYDNNNTIRYGTEAGNVYVAGWGAAQWTARHYYWRDLANPFLARAGGADPWDCTAYSWAITVCLGHPGTDSAGNVLLGSMQPIHFDDQYHLIAAVIRINPWHNWDSEQLMNVVEHEIGHALGLGHQYGSNNFSVMNTPVANRLTLQYPNFHDDDALAAMYDTHYHPG